MSEKPTIQEVIVVEGRHDTMRLKEIFHCKTIETGGTSLGEDVFDQIQQAKEATGVIIFTDPDTPGNQIRQRINERIPGCINIFVDKHEARTDKKVGVEHAEKEAIIEAFQNQIVYEKPKDTISFEEYYDLGLAGSKDAQEKRDIIGKAFHLGNANAKTMLSRLQYLGITKEQIEEVLNG